MNCEYWRNQIALHVEGDLSLRKSRAAKKHLDVCPDCRQFARDLSQSQAILKSLGHEAIDGKVFEAIQERVIGEFVARKASMNHRWWPPTPWNWRWTGALSMGLLLLLGAREYWNLEPPGERLPASNSRPGKLGALSKDTSNGERATQPGPQMAINNHASTGVQTVTKKAKAIRKQRVDNAFSKAAGRSKSAVTKAEKPRSEDGRFLGSLPEKENASVEVARGESKEKQSGRGNDATETDPLVVKLVTDDPEIVIVWLIDQTRGASQ